MAISDADYKLLWSRAAGICSNPICRDDLTVMLSPSWGYNVGEMAHIIAHNESGPRGRAGGGSDNYGNLVLLCPTCHTKIDKAPEGQYTESMILNWKSSHEQEIRKAGRNFKFATLEDLKLKISRLLEENKQIWVYFGPKSKYAENDPSSNAVEIWNLRKIGTIVPNNNQIINTLEANFTLLPSNLFSLFLMFKNHALAFELNQHDRLDQYPLFPSKFGEEFTA